MLDALTRKIIGQNIQRGGMYYVDEVTQTDHAKIHRTKTIYACGTIA